MKLTILGAASPRFPLLLHSILRQKIAVDELVLYDIDGPRMELFRDTILEEVLSHYGSTLRVTVPGDFDRAVSGADYIFSSIRVGGQESRLLDEQVPLEFGHLGQETVGAGGFSLALRTIPVAVAQADRIYRLAPDAWIINFTNPAGIITQAVRTLSGHTKIVGICDAPEVITKIVCELYDVSFERVKIDYFGINHLGWVHSVTLDDREILGELISDRLEPFFAMEPFYRGMKQEIMDRGLLPNEYFYYYLHHDEVVKNQQKTGMRRAAQIHEFDLQLFNNLRKRDGCAIAHFNRYIDQRNGSYMTNETGFDRPAQSFSLLDQNKEWGYDAVALSVLKTLMSATPGASILNIENQEYCRYLDRNDIIEVSAVLREGDFRPRGTMPVLPESYMRLLQTMKVYERNLIQAVGEGSALLAGEALKLNPLIRPESANALWQAIRHAHREELSYLV